jgi:DNA-directed RNA polymerase specialized sigma24 family protein
VERLHSSCSDWSKPLTRFRNPASESLPRKIHRAVQATYGMYMAADLRRRLTHLISGLVLSNAAPRAPAFVDTEDTIGLQAALAALSTDDLDLLVLQVRHGYSMETIAATRELTIEDVRTRLFQARKRVRTLSGANTALDPE